MKYATICRRRNRTAVLKYEFDIACYVCELNVVKTKNQLTKVQRKKNINFKVGLPYAAPKIVDVCMEINSLVQTNNIDVLGAVLTYLKQKK